MPVLPSHVVAGEAIRADFVNNLIDYIHANVTPTSSPEKAARIFAVACVNGDAEADILAGEPVYINTGSSVYNVNTPILSVIPYDGTHDEYPVGVARFDMQSEEGGQVILAGLAVVKVASITTGAYLKPTDDGKFEFTDDATQFRFIGTVTQADDTSSATKVLAFIGKETAGDAGIGDYPFKVSVSGNAYSVQPGYVYAYHQRYASAGDSGTLLSDHVYVYCEADANTASHTLADVSVNVCEANAFPGFEERVPNHHYYRYIIADISRENENSPWTVLQCQFGNLVTPLVRQYIPVVDSSLRPFMKIVEGEGDEMKLMLQDNPDPGKNKVLGTDKNKKLEWRTCPCGSGGPSGSSSSSSPSGSSSSSSPSGSSSLSSPSGAGSSIIIDPSKYYSVISCETYPDRYGEYKSYGDLHTMQGDLLLHGEAVRELAGYDLIISLPVYDPETGEYIGEREEVYGFYQLLIVSGPWDTRAEADAWNEQHRGDYY